MVAGWIEKLTGSLEQKKQYNEAKARIEALPEPYLTAANATNRYVTYYGGVCRGRCHRADVSRPRGLLGARIAGSHPHPRHRR